MSPTEAGPGVGADGKMGAGGGDGQSTGGKGNVNGSFGSLTEEEDLHNRVPVLEGVAVTVVVVFMRDGAVYILEQDALRETRSFVSRSLVAQLPHVMNTAPIELERDSVESKAVNMYEYMEII